MSLQLISRNDDLKLLQDEGYEVSVLSGHLLVAHVPYVNSKKQVAYGTLVSPLDLAGDKTIKPSNHVVYWVGEYPCDSKGSQMVKLVNDPNFRLKISEGLETTCQFSHKPDGGYANYHEKMSRYIKILEAEAHVIDPTATAQTHPVIRTIDGDSVFCYVDNASSHAGTTAINEKLRARIAIVGLGGTGAYILDFVAKTLVNEIHLFDGDRFLQHNAFRSPGAPSCEDLGKQLTKVEWFAENYSRMRKKIIPHFQFIDDTNVSELETMDFVFLCLDNPEAKKIIVEYLVEKNISFIDVGMGLVQNEAIGGAVRVTACTPSFHEHVARRINFINGEDEVYSRNIQIVEMNALNAALAVIKWKKLCGFYADLEHEHHTVYSIPTNELINDDLPIETKTDHA